MTDKQESAIEFPCEFPIKAMAKSMVGIENKILAIIQAHAPEVNEGAMRTTASSKGKYVSVTITINAQSQLQLDNIYGDLTRDPNVLMAF